MGPVSQMASHGSCSLKPNVRMMAQVPSGRSTVKWKRHSLGSRSRTSVHQVRVICCGEVRNWMYPYTQLEHIRKVLQACTTASSGLIQTGAPDLSSVLEA